jgi:hypothetical protein
LSLNIQNRFIILLEADFLVSLMTPSDSLSALQTF